MRTGAASGVLRLDRNVGQVTDSNGTLYPMTDLGRLDSKLARKQRLRARKRKGSLRARRLGGQLTTLRRKQKRVRDNDTHHISRTLADKAHTLVAEALNTKGMTKSARGTQAQQTHVAIMGPEQGIPQPPKGVAATVMFRVEWLVREESLEDVENLVHSRLPQN